MARLRRVAYLAASAVAAVGIILGTEAQREAFTPFSDVHLEQSSAAGAIVALTGLVVAVAAAAMAWALAPARRWRLVPWTATARRVLVALALAACAYVVVLVLQSAFPNYVVCHQDAAPGAVPCHSATLRVQLILHNEPANPALLAPVWSVLLAAMLGIAWCTRRLLGRTNIPPTARATYEDQVAASALATPFLAVVGWGAYRLLLDVPSTPHRLALGLTCAAVAGLWVAQLLRLRALAHCVRDPRRAPATLESWHLLRRLELAAALLLIAVALAAALLPGAPADELVTPKTYQSTLRAHLGAQALLLVALIPGWRLGRPVDRLLRTLAAADRTTLTPPLRTGRRLWGATAACLVSAAAAGYVTTLYSAGPLWAWLVAFVPVGAVAATTRGRLAPAALLLAGVAAWAAGNAVFGHFDGASTNFLVQESSGLQLGLLRVAGCLLAAIALARANGAARVASACAAASVVAAAFLELPLGAWVDSSDVGNSIAVGSLLDAQDPAVRILAHVATVGLAVVAAWLVARRVRPDWSGPLPSRSP